MGKPVSFLTGAADGTTSTTFTTDSSEYLLSVGGAFDGGTITFNIEEQGTWVPVTDGIFTAGGQKVLQVAQGIKLQAVTSGGGVSMAVDASIYPRY